MKKNIVLIGMPGSGKSTIGVLLAKAINYQFIDGDLLIQRQEKKTLVDIINEKGIDAFLAIENQVLREINTEASVIATGGSAIFSEEAMKHLGEQGLIVYLDVSCEEIIRRVNNISTRGIAMKPGKTLADLYEERKPYYEKYAQLTIPCDGKTMEQCVQAIAELLISSTLHLLPIRDLRLFSLLQHYLYYKHIMYRILHLYLDNENCLPHRFHHVSMPQYSFS